MLISYKGIVPERFEDAPFVGALLIANDCHMGCKGCFNQHLRDIETLTETTDEILDKVQANPLHEGIILAGLEWSEQLEQMIDLVTAAKRRGLQVMIYTGHTLDEFIEVVGNDNYYDKLAGCYLKLGKYDETKLTKDIEWCGVKMASFNQYILKIPGPFQENTQP